MSLDNHINLTHTGITVSFVIVHYNAADSLHACLKSLFEYCRRPDIEIIVIDNASPDRSWSEIIPNEHPGLTVKEMTENMGFAVASNRGAHIARGDYLFFINPDIVFVQDPLPEMLAFFEKEKDVGTVGPRLLYPDGRLQPSRGTFPHLLLTFSQLFSLKRFLPRDEKLIPFVGPVLGNLFAQWRKPDHPQEVDYTTGAAIMIRRDLFLRQHGFDERFFLYFEEIDLCYRLHDAGYSNFFLPSVTMHHHVSSSIEPSSGFKDNTFKQSLLVYYEIHTSRTSIFLVKALLKMTSGRLRT